MDGHDPLLVLHGCYNNDNFGDLLILDLMSRRLRDRLGIEPVCPWISSRSRGKVLAECGGGWSTCLRANAAVFGGGGYFCDYFRRSLRYSLPARIWRSRHVPYVVVGVGAGPFVSAAAAEQFAIVCEGAKRVCVRDDASREIVESWGVDPANLEVTADIMLGLTRDAIPTAAEERAQALLSDIPHGSVLLGLNFPDFFGPRFLTPRPPFAERHAPPIVEKIVAVIARALDGHARVVPVWLEVGGGRSTWRAIERACHGILPHSRFLEPVDHWTAAAVIDRLDAVITSRLHVGIVAWTLGTPCCAFASHGKTRRFYKQIGREAFVADAGEDPKIIGEWIRLLLEEPGTFAQYDPVAAQRIGALTERNYAVAAEHLGPALGRW